MANSYINSNTIISGKNKTLAQLCNDIKAADDLIKEIQNLLKDQGICAIGGANDMRITVPGSWGSIIIYDFEMLTNSNSNLYEYSGGGIKILKSGLYKVSGTINLDLTTASFEIYSNKKGYICIQDYDYKGQMVNLVGISWPLWLDAGEIIYPALRASGSYASNIILRKGRSIFTVERVLHL